MSLPAAYRELQESRLPGLRGAWAICRWNLRIVFRHRIFWILFALGMLHFLFHFAIIYIKAQLTVQAPGFAKFIDNYRVTGTGDAYCIFLAVQTEALALLLAYVGVALVTSDHRAGGLAFYLARPIGRNHYVLGKLLVCAGVGALVTLLPALALFLEYGLFSSSISYWSENPRILFGIVAYSLLLMSAPGLLLLGLGSVCRRAAPLVTIWCILMFVSPVLAELLAHVFEANDWRLLNPVRCLRLVGSWAFGMELEPDEAAHRLSAAGMVAAACLASLATLAQKLRPVEVVS